jgi:hypothetical protein
MVKVHNIIRRDGQSGPFVLLELQGDLELVQSAKTGLFYGTVRRCTIPCTTTYETARAFVGKEIPGSIIRVECTPYTYVAPESGEALELAHRWSYVPEEKPTTAPVMKMSVSEQAA